MLLNVTEKASLYIQATTYSTSTKTDCLTKEILMTQSKLEIYCRTTEFYKVFIILSTFLYPVQSMVKAFPQDTILQLYHHDTNYLALLFLNFVYAEVNSRVLVETSFVIKGKHLVSICLIKIPTDDMTELIA